MRVQNIQPLQDNVNLLGQWAKEWGMQFNTKKCVHMQINKDTPDFRIKLNDQEIPTSTNMKYLGVCIQSDLKWHSHITNITGKANRALGNIKRSLNGAPVKTKLIAYKTVVLPILEYASQVWSPYLIGLAKSLEKTQRNAIRWIFHLDKYASISDRMKQHNILSLSDRREKLDTLVLRKIEAGLFDIRLNPYIKFATNHNTRGKTISHQHRTNQWKHSYYNRMRDQVKVYFPDD